MVKVTIVGVGHVGSTIAYSVLMKGLADEIVLINRTPARAEGEAADLNHAAAFASRHVTVRAGGTEAAYGSQVIVFTMSAPLDRESASRTQVAESNKQIIENWIPRLAKICPDAVFLIVSNPVDAMTYLAWKCSGLAWQQVIGSGTLIDSARYRSYLSDHLQIHPEDIRAYVLGEHGDSQFPAVSIAATGGEKLDELAMGPEMFERTVNEAREILRIKGYTNYAIALACSLIIESIVNDSRRTLPVSTWIDGFCDVQEIFLSVPCLIGQRGVIRQLQPSLSQSEQESFRKSAEAVRSVLKRLGYHPT